MGQTTSGKDGARWPPLWNGPTPFPSLHPSGLFQPSIYSREETPGDRPVDEDTRTSAAFFPNCSPLFSSHVRAGLETVWRTFSCLQHVPAWPVWWWVDGSCRRHPWKPAQTPMCWGESIVILLQRALPDNAQLPTPGVCQQVLADTHSGWCIHHCHTAPQTVNHLTDSSGTLILV